MKTGMICLAATLAMALAGCNRDRAPAAADAMSTPPPADTAAADANANVPDTDMPSADTGQQEALGLLAAVDEHEIAAAQQAKSKNVDGAELDYANMMESAHSQNLAATRALMMADAAEPAAVADLKAKGQAELDRLGALQGDEYEDAYIDAMVNGHQDALAMLDSRLIPAARDAAVRQHLQSTREQVAAHLERARELQAD
ncbi:DUF4142 domain-containing protein [Luteimonas sp. 8-5]|uniref:DUF4142 domain-containing protein n=1 Tax=Luteimonas sp. 8-5 TaxID=3039387 RepID=UPI002436A1F3|nr:DUF4142 domain-containing protein [Luteimonas sp. 8-5]MDG6347707.1 DUF4142 domain-containing protein [Luteimonas sp. 8-5]